DRGRRRGGGLECRRTGPRYGGQCLLQPRALRDDHPPAADHLARRELMEPRSLTLSAPLLVADQLGFFRWGRVAGRTLVTNDAGDWTFLSDEEFSALLGGRVADGHQRFPELQGKGFLRDGLDLDGFAARVARRNRHVARGVNLHVVELTRRCNENC